MQFFHFLSFIILCPIVTSMTVSVSGARRLTVIGRVIGVLACFAAIRYLVIPIWMPDDRFWQCVKAVLEVIVLHGLTASPALYWKEGAFTAISSLASSLAVRLVFIVGLYLAFYDVISVWPVFGQLWYWAYILMTTVICGWLGEAWLVHMFSWLRKLLRCLIDSKRNPPVFDMKLSCLGMIVLTLISLASFVYFVVCIVSSDYRHSTNDYLDDIVVTLRENVSRNFPAFTKKTSGIMQLWDEVLKEDREILDKRHPRTADVRSRSAIKRSLNELREMLLPFDSRRVLLRIKHLDGKIASCRESLDDLRERRRFHPEKAETLDARIAKEEGRLAALEASKGEAMEKTRADLKAIGLDFPKNSPFLMVDLGDLIDNAIVAKNTGLIVENLKTVVDAAKGDTDAAKRYYGAYIVMLEVQSECFRQYLNKAATGIWRNGVDEVVKNAEAARKVNELKAAAEGRSEQERAAFQHAAGTNAKTLKAAQAYLAILKHHEDVVKEKIKTIEKRHEIALSFWESVDIASAFTDHISSDMADFEALLELKLPEIAIFDDVAMQAEFDAITQKLMKE